MTTRLKFAALVAAVGVLVAAPVFAQDELAHAPKATAYVKKNIQPWLSDPVVIKAILASNKAHARLMQTDIDDLDKKWATKDQAMRDSHAPAGCRRWRQNCAPRGQGRRSPFCSTTTRCRARWRRQNSLAGGAGGCLSGSKGWARCAS